MSVSHSAHFWDIPCTHDGIRKWRYSNDWHKEPSLYQLHLCKILDCLCTYIKSSMDSFSATHELQCDVDGQRFFNHFFSNFRTSLHMDRF